MGVVTAIASGCVVSDLALEGLPCPCASTEWQCDPSTDTCVRTDPGPFSIAVTPGSVMVPQSGRNSFQIELTSATEQRIVVTPVALPDGVGAIPGELVLSPASPRGELTLTATTTAPIGSAAFEVEGTGPGGDRDRASVAVEIGEESGSLDVSFGNTGVAPDLLGVSSLWSARIAVRPDDRIILTASAESSCVLAQYTAEGRPDASFGTTGLGLGVPTSTGQDDLECVPTDVQILDDGKFVIAGFRDVSSATSSTPTLTQYLADGRLDPSFGAGGIALGAPGVRLTRIAVRNDGKLVGMGLVDDGGQAFGSLALFRFLADGRPDPSFGIDGRILPEPLGSGLDVGQSLLLGADGSIVVAGRINSVPTRGFLARFSADGVLDETFGSGGVALGAALTDFTVVAPGPGGSLLVGGRRSAEAGVSGVDDGSFVARYRPDGRLDPAFGDDGVTDFVSRQPLDTVVIGIAATPVAPLLVADAQLLMALDADGRLDSDYGYVRLPASLSAIAVQQSGKLIGIAFDADVMRLWP